MKKHLWLIITIAVIVALGGWSYASNHQKVTPSLETITATEAPWPNNVEHLKERLAALNLPALQAEGNVLHIHQHLEFYLHGKQIAIPANIGLHEAPPAFISIIHTHDESGIIHVESPHQGTFYLGQFFDIWGVKFSSDCIGAYCSNDTDKLKIFVNGEPFTGDVRQLELTAHQEIVITYGTDAEIPQPIPASYTFPTGY